MTLFTSFSHNLLKFLYFSSWCVRKHKSFMERHHDNFRFARFKNADLPLSCTWPWKILFFYTLWSYFTIFFYPSYCIAVDLEKVSCFFLFGIQNNKIKWNENNEGRLRMCNKNTRNICHLFRRLLLITDTAWNGQI